MGFCSTAALLSVVFGWAVALPSFCAPPQSNTIPPLATAGAKLLQSHVFINSADRIQRDLVCSVESVHPDSLDVLILRVNLTRQ